MNNLILFKSIIHIIIKMQLNSLYMFRQILLLLFISLVFTAKSQEVLPIDGSTINYIHVLFEVPRISSADRYNFYIYKCNKRAESCTLLKIIHSKFYAVIENEALQFNATYTWRYEALKGNKTIYKSREFNFNTGYSDLLDTTLQKIEFSRLPKKGYPGILFIDGMKLALDMAGKPIYYLNYKYDHAVRDINLTKQGTITIVDNRLGEVKEMKLSGEMIWIGPTKHDETELRTDKYHHEFEKLFNGNYIAAGKRKVSSFEESAGLDGVPGTTLSEAIIEFDKEVNEVWRFDLLPELKRQFNIAPTTEVFNPTRLGHLNGIAVDEKKEIVYASFKTFNTVMKIDKQSKNILYMYGLKRINFRDSTEEGLDFEQQHNPTFHPNGNLLIFNNGNEKTGSGITELRTGEQVDSTNEVVRKVYFKGIIPEPYYAVQMGSVQALSNHRMLVCMGSLNQLFELDVKSKKLIWHAHTYQNFRWSEGRKIWKPLLNYRCNYYSSLYPYHYICYADITGSKLNLTIVNNGSETDTYIIYKEINELPRVFLNRVTIKPGKSTTIKLKDMSAKNFIRVVSVSSKTEQIPQ
jgi:hypothetical protein